MVDLIMLVLIEPQIAITHTLELQERQVGGDGEVRRLELVVDSKVDPAAAARRRWGEIP